MNRIKKASVLYLVIPICLAIVIFILWYGYPFKKFTDQNLKVYQLALTAFAATVGIGTVVNSSRSADTALKSMELTTKKELREQSSHLVVSSTLTKFGISPPMYNNEYVYSPSGINSKFYVELTEELNEDELEYMIVEESATRTVDALILERLFKDKPFNHMKVLNIGKGSSINVEISFEFVNREDFDGYTVASENKLVQPTGTSFYPSYDLNVSQNKEKCLIEIVDNTALYYLRFINSHQYHTGFHQEVNLVFENSEVIKYTDFIKSQDAISFPIPNEFMILCKHYSIVHYYKKLNELNRINSFVLPNIQHLIASPSIKPLGRLTLKYYEEEMVRTNYYEDLKKKEIMFDIKLKDDSIFVEDTDLNFYLEVTPVPVKEPQKT